MISPNYIVALGASAGGLLPIQDFFDNIPNDTGMSFIVIQHLSPDFRSMMDELLKKNTSMPIFQAQDGVFVEANSIYLIPPKTMMSITSDGKLSLKEQERSNQLKLPINIFFTSLANHYGAKAIGIIFSGTGADGSKGAVEISEHEGLVIAQDPASAKFDGMPRSVIATRCVNKVLAPEKMGQFLIDFIKVPEKGDGKETLADYEGFEGEYSEIFKLLFDRHNINLETYKPGTVTRRIERRVRALNFNTLDEYINVLKNDDVELETLLNDLLIGVTHFFRDEDAWIDLKKMVFPKLLERIIDTENPIRIWVCACSTGQEVYSLALMLDAFLESMGSRASYKIFATDINDHSIRFASQGIYPQELIEQIPYEDLRRKFHAIGDGNMKISAKIRNNIVFTTQNAISSSPFSKMDLILCRNMLIYLKNESQRKLLSHFHFGLKPSGFLFLGPSESITPFTSEFESLSQKWKIYRKHSTSRLPIVLPSPQQHMLRSDRGQSTPNLGYSLSESGMNTSTFDLVLKQMFKDGLIITERNEVSHVFGKGGKLLGRVSSGRLLNDVASLLRGEFKISVGTAVTQVRIEKEPILLQRIQLEDEVVDLKFSPVTDSSQTVRFIILEVFSPESVVSEAPRILDLSTETEKLLSSLQGELQATRESLQTSIEEGETANEELQSSNEELLAANEELQSTNEELHSVNEELYTVNSEYQEKISELSQLNTDVENILVSSSVGTLFLNKDLTIRKFTPQVSELMHLVNHDVGRPIGHFEHVFPNLRLTELAASVIRDRISTEKEVELNNHRWVKVLISPYLRERVAEGAIVNFTDVTDARRQYLELQTLAADLRGANDRFRYMEEAVSVGIWDWWDVNSDEVYYSEKFFQMIGHPVKNPSSVQKFWNLMHEEDRGPMQSALLEAMTSRQEKFSYRYRLITPIGDYRWFQSNAKIIFSTSGAPTRLVGSLQDIHDEMVLFQRVTSEIEILINKVPYVTLALLAISSGVSEVQNFESNYYTKLIKFSILDFLKELQGFGDFIFKKSEHEVILFPKEDGEITSTREMLRHFALQSFVALKDSHFIGNLTLSLKGSKGIYVLRIQLDHPVNLEAMRKTPLVSLVSALPKLIPGSRIDIGDSAISIQVKHHE